MNIINLTPHAISLRNRIGKFDIIKPSGVIARVAQITDEAITTESVANLVAYGYRVTRNTYGSVENLPAPQADTIYIVSALVAQAVPERDDVFIPNESVRDSEGRIIGCESLAHI